MSFSPAPGLLIALPNVTDPLFQRSVILLCAHSEEGAFGLILNRKLDLSMALVCKEAGLSWQGSPAASAFCGGPVDPHRGWVIHAASRTYEGTQMLNEDLAVSAGKDALAAYAQAPGDAFQLVLGYAGWGAGQLEKEFLQGSWLSLDLDPELVLHTPRITLWQDALARLGITPSQLVESSGHVH